MDPAWQSPGQHGPPAQPGQARVQGCHQGADAAAVQVQGRRQIAAGQRNEAQEVHLQPSGLHPFGGLQGFQQVGGRQPQHRHLGQAVPLDAFDQEQPSGRACEQRPAQFRGQLEGGRVHHS